MSKHTKKCPWKKGAMDTAIRDRQPPNPWSVSRTIFSEVLNGALHAGEQKLTSVGGSIDSEAHLVNR